MLQAQHLCRSSSEASVPSRQLSALGNVAVTFCSCHFKWTPRKMLIRSTAPKQTKLARQLQELKMSWAEIPGMFLEALEED